MQVVAIAYCIIRHDRMGLRSFGFVLLALVLMLIRRFLGYFELRGNFGEGLSYADNVFVPLAISCCLAVHFAKLPARAPNADELKQLREELRRLRND